MPTGCDRHEKTQLLKSNSIYLTSNVEDRQQSGSEQSPGIHWTWVEYLLYVLLTRSPSCLTCKLGNREDEIRWGMGSTHSSSQATCPPAAAQSAREDTAEWRTETQVREAEMSFSLFYTETGNNVGKLEDTGVWTPLLSCESCKVSRPHGEETLPWSQDMSSSGSEPGLSSNQSGLRDQENGHAVLTLEENETSQY